MKIFKIFDTKKVAENCTIAYRDYFKELLIDIYKSIEC